MAEWWQALVLGVVQGVTEFMPVSSTAHLVLVPWLLGWQDPWLESLSFDVALHLGTLLAILGFFWRDWLRLLRAGYMALRGQLPTSDPSVRVLALLILATVPGALGGFLFEKEAETVFRTPWLVGAGMVIMGLVLAGSERLGRRALSMEALSWPRALAIGLSQVLAIVPGVSRSGATITAGLFTGLRREDAARFSFLMATPIVAGAGLLQLRHIVVLGLSGDHPAALAAGFLAAAVSGYLCIWGLLAYLRTRTVYPFVWYRVVVGVSVVVLWALRAG